MGINPETLTEDTREARNERQNRTGTVGNGLTVICTPDVAKPDVFQVQHRAVCMFKPYVKCHGCEHGHFTLVFNVTPEARYQRVLCPRWSTGRDRLGGEQPAEYTTTEVATCSEKPFEFCPSCPSKEELMKLDIDKGKEGWYARWKRFKEDEVDE